MTMRVLSLALLLTLPLSTAAHADTATPTVGQKPVGITLTGDDGGLVKDGGAWSSDSLKDKINLVLYVDPDKSDLNDLLTERLKKEAFPPDKFASVAIVNMAATWKPNAVISSVLKSKQAAYPNTTYVKDYKSHLVKDWGLKDDAYETMLFDREGRLLFRHEGELKDAQVEELVALVKKALS